MSAALRVLVADDELLARRRLARLLASVPDVQLAGECGSGQEVLDCIGELSVDVVLLDIQMPGLTGIEALQRMPPDGPYVIFCTAHPDHALAAFDAGAVDYLLKPVEAERLQRALERARSREARGRFQEELLKQRSGVPARLALETRAGIVLLSPGEVESAELDGELVTVFTAKERHLTDLNLQQLQARLPAGTLERVHRRALLNLSHVVRLEPVETGGFVARTRSGRGVEVSRQAARQLRKQLGLR
jgi:two-component system LytT family response regulator